MAMTPYQLIEEIYVPGETTHFIPPIETSCVPAVPCKSKGARKTFVSAVCIRRDTNLGGFLFRGIPLGEEEEHLFVVDWDEDGAEGVPAARIIPFRLNK